MGAFLVSICRWNRHSLVKSGGGAQVELTALLVRGATAKDLGFPVGRPLCVYMDGTNNMKCSQRGRVAMISRALPCALQAEALRLARQRGT